MDFASLIKMRRIEMGLSQVELAALTDVSLPTIQNIERKLGNPSLQTITSLANELGVEITFSSQELDWPYLVNAGVPLVDSAGSGQTQQITTLARTARELRKLLYCQLSHRELKAVAALLLAMEHHFPSVARRVISKKLRLKFKQFYTAPEILKLKRIATARLATYL